MSLHDKQMAHGLFPLQFSRFSFALGGFCQTAEKVAVSILSMGFFAVFKFFLCFRALHPGQLPKCCNLHTFPTAGRRHFYDFIVLRDQAQFLSSIAKVS